MIEGGEDFRLALESDETIGIGCHRRRQDLDGNLTLQIGVGCAIHLPIPPTPRAARIPIRAEA